MHERIQLTTVGGAGFVATVVGGAEFVAAESRDSSAGGIYIYIIGAEDWLEPVSLLSHCC